MHKALEKPCKRFHFGAYSLLAKNNSENVDVAQNDVNLFNDCFSTQGMRIEQTRSGDLVGESVISAQMSHISRAWSRV
jgi:hypothetical protein